MSAVPAVVEQPRPFGYVVGDIVEQRVLLQADPTALPRAGRVGVWFDRRMPSISQDAQGRRWLVVDYQLINAPQGLTTVNMPAWELATKSGQTLSIPQWPLSVGPLTGRTVIAQGGLQALRADRPAPIVPTEPIARQIEIWTGAFALTLLIWIAWLAWRNWRDARDRPFARAAREMRGVGDDAPAGVASTSSGFRSHCGARRSDRDAGESVRACALPGAVASANRGVLPVLGGLLFRLRRRPHCRYTPYATTCAGLRGGTTRDRIAGLYAPVALLLAPLRTVATVAAANRIAVFLGTLPFCHRTAWADSHPLFGAGSRLWPCSESCSSWPVQALRKRR